MKTNKYKFEKEIESVAAEPTIEPEMKTPKDFSKEMNESIIDGFEEGVKEAPIPEPEEPVFNPQDGIVTACTSLYVRSAAHSNATPVDVISEGRTVKVIGEEGEFWKIESPEGYCKKQFIKLI